MQTSRLEYRASSKQPKFILSDNQAEKAEVLFKNIKRFTIVPSFIKACHKICFKIF